MKTVLYYVLLTLIVLLAGFAGYLTARIVRLYLRTSRLEMKKNYEIIVLGSLLKLETTQLYDLLLPLAAANSRVMEEVLAKVAGEADPSIRARVQEVFDHLGFFDRRVKLLRSLRSRRAAYSAEMLGNIGDSRAVRGLSRLLESSNYRVADAALYALGKIGTQESLSEITKILDHPTRWTQDRIAAAVEAVGRPAMSLLIRNLEEGTPQTRTLSAEILAKVGGEEALPALRDALRDPHTDVRARAAAALGRLRDRNSLEQLLGALEDTRWEVRSQAAKALGEVEDPIALPHLAQALRDPEWWVRANAEEAMRRMGEAGEKELAAMLYDDDRFARETAAQALQELGIPERYLELAEAGEDLETLKPILKRMAEIGAVGPLVTALLNYPSDTARLALMRDLAGIADPRLAAIYRELAGTATPSLREAARQALASLSGRERTA